MTIGEFLAWLTGAGGIGYLCARLIEWLYANWPSFSGLRPDLKRLVAFTITGLAAAGLGAATILVSAWLGYEPLPPSAQVWVERLFSVAAAAIIAGQVTHGASVLRRKARA